MNNKIKTKWTRIVFSTLSILTIVSIMIISLWWSHFNKTMVIKKIILSEAKILDSNHYSTLFKEYMGKRTDEIALEQISKILEEHPYIKATRLSKRYPSIIKVEIIEREPIAILQIDPMVLLDKEGYVLPDAGNLNSYNLPIMTNFNPEVSLYPVGKKALSMNVEHCIYWLKQIKENYISLYNNLSEMKMTSDNEMELILSDQPTQIYLGRDHIVKRINTLKKFENMLKPKQLSDFNYLDMRYENQIIAKNRSL